MSECKRLILDCREGSRKASFAKGVIGVLCDPEAFVVQADRHLQAIGTSADALLRGESHGCGHHDHAHGHDQGTRNHAHGHDARDHAHAHDHGHHSPDEVHTRIDSMGLGEGVKADMFGVYDILAAAEAKAHDVDVSGVHFHEVGNTDAIGCIALSCLAMEQLKREQNICRIEATPVCTGFGFVDCAHGRLPIPAPATANVLSGVPTFESDEEGELTTPTGAALVRYFACSFDAKIPDASERTISGGALEDTVVCKVG